MKLAEVAFACYVYSHMSDYDNSYRQLLTKTTPQLDLSQEHHRMALLVWLNSWGCRQFAKDHHSTAASEIFRWYETIRTRLFPEETTLLSLTEEDFTVVEQVYAELFERTASRREQSPGKNSNVMIGPTGTAKILFALRPGAVIPWDEPIRIHFKADGSPGSYIGFLRMVQANLEDLAQECMRKGIDISELPSLLGRPASSLSKLMDEYFWVTISRRCLVPTTVDLSRWAAWG